MYSAGDEHGEWGVAQKGQPHKDDDAYNASQATPNRPLLANSASDQLAWGTAATSLTFVRIISMTAEARPAKWYSSSPRWGCC